MPPKDRVLIVDDESSITDTLEQVFAARGYDVTTAGSYAEACAALTAKLPFSLALADLRLPDASGIQLIERVKAESPETEVILVTGHGSLDLAIEAIKKGAYYYLEKPFTTDQVLTLAERARQFAAVRRENRVLRRSLEGEHEFLGIHGRAPKMKRIFETIRATAPSDASVLVEGESGTGKELVANALHLHSRRSAKTFIRVNCAAIPRDLMESEMFGYRRGAFTGADRDKRGLIEMAAGGTLLLDEIAEMPTHLQTKLLRVLQERRLRRLGDEQEISVDFRLISATNQDTAQAVREGALRKDLYFRISTVKIRVPPLRERLDDLPLLAEKFLARYAGKYDKPVRSISATTCAILLRYDWPGNVRELEGVVEHAVLLCGANEVRPEDLPEHLQEPRLAASARCVIPPFMTLEDIESDAIRQTIERTGGNIKKAAQILNIHRPTLYRKLKKMGGLNGSPNGVAAPNGTEEA